MNLRGHIPGAMLALLATLAWACSAQAQTGDEALLKQADALFGNGEYAKAHPMYSQLVSLSPRDHDLNYKYGACILYGDEDKSKAIGYLRYATTGPATANLVWYFLGRAYQLDYQFDEAVAAFQHFRGTADKKLLARFPVDVLEQQCRNGTYLLSNLKDIEVHSKVEVEATDFFRFYDLSDIGGKIVVTPPELLSSLDRKSGENFLTYLPANGGPIFFSSYGRDGKTGRDIYRTEVLPTGGFAAPVKLAGYINTAQDEDYAVMAPDGRSFFFSSKGHNSMGGYDVFRSSYDPGMDVFGPPENMDFAVNTPADERLYIVGPDGTQACFASDRDSRQGMLNVYRVGTAQTPINITVLKGTYANAFDPADRKARIIVEDNLTRERVADVATDENGAYVLALPRGGNYTVLVEVGATGRTHLASLEVPASTRPAAYSQEIEMVEQGGVQVQLRSHFDQPLDEDVMALALDEIRRRARLDVTGAKAIAQEQETARPSVQDPLRSAGFDGTVTMDQAVGLAVQEAEAATGLADVQQQQAHGAFEIARENVEAAEAAMARAMAVVKQADHEADEAAKAPLLREAAMAKQQALAAAARAQAAYQASVEIGEAGALNRKRAVQAAALSEELQQARSQKDHARTTEALRELKTALDEANGPAARIDQQERMRRSATAAGEEAARRMRQATAQREEETLLADRIGRLGRETEEAKGRRKAELQDQLSTLQAQRDAMHDEVEAAFQQAREAEDTAALLRGQAALAGYLEDAPATHPAEAPGQGAIAALVQRVEQVRAENRALQIDPMHAPMEMASAEDRERRIFNWGADRDVLADGGNGAGGSRTQVRDVQTAASPMATTDRADRAPGTRQAETGAVQPASEGQEGLVEPAYTEAQASGNGHVEGRSPAEGTRTDSSPGSTAAAAPAGTGTGGLQDLATADTGQVQTAEARNGESEGSAGRTNASTPEAAQASAGNDGAAPASLSADEQAFLLANKLAELEQLRQGEKDRSRRDSLDQAIAGQQALIAAFQAGEKVDGQEVGALPHSHVYTYLDFDMAILDEELAEEAFPGFSLRRKAIEEGTASPGEKAAMLHALEMQLIDSIDVHAARLLATLEQEPQLADQLLPRLERWNQLKAVHATNAAEVLAAVDREYAASETKAMEDAELAARTPEQRPVAGQSISQTPHNDAYIAIKEDLDRIYASPVTPRSGRSTEAIALKDRDLEAAERMRTEIDSMQRVLGEMPAGKAYDKLRQQTDRKIDDLLILQVDLGQRLAYIGRNEMAVAQDSAKLLARSLSRQGIAANEPLWLMAGAYVEAAEAAVAKARAFRKQADNARDIFKRNSLYRQAYAEELKALRDYDRSHTVRNYLLSGGAAPGEALAYEEVEQRMFPAAFAQAAPPLPATPARSAGTGAQEAGQAPASTQPATGQDAEAGQDAAADRLAQATVQQPEESEAALPPTGAPDPVATVATLPGLAHAPADSIVLSEYLDSYYYLTPDEHRTVMGGEEESRYFMMKGRAMQVREEAMVAETEADGAESLASMLRGEAEVLRETPAAEQEPGQLQKMEARAVALAQRSDSLRGLAERLNASATLHDAQAATLMQGMPAARSAAIMDLEQGRRRTEPLLARTRPRPASPETTMPRPEPAAERPEAVPPGEVPPAQAVASDGSPVSAQHEEETALEQQRQPPSIDRHRAGQPAPEPHSPAAVAGEGTAADAVPAQPAEALPAASREDGPARMPGRAPRMDRPSIPMDRPLAQDVFQFEERIAPREEAIPLDVPLPAGIVYKVQVGAFRNELPLEAFSDMTPVTGEHAGNGLVRYTAGLFTTAESASEAGARVRERGYHDAFVVAYMDGERVPLRDAMRAEQARPVADLAALPPPATPVPPSSVAPAAEEGAGGVNVAPPPVTPIPQAAPADAVLAAYPPTAAEVLASFRPAGLDTAYYNDPDAAPAKQVEAVQGLFFTVQVGVYSKPTPLDRLFNVTPLNSELTATGKIRYTTGIYREEAQAAQRRTGAVALGVTDAFITAYLNGKRIPIRDARALLARFGAEVLVAPTQVTGP